MRRTCYWCKRDLRRDQDLYCAWCIRNQPWLHTNTFSRSNNYFTYPPDVLKGEPPELLVTPFMAMVTIFGLLGLLVLNAFVLIAGLYGKESWIYFVLWGILMVLSIPLHQRASRREAHGSRRDHRDYRSASTSPHPRHNASGTYTFFSNTGPSLSGAPALTAAGTRASVTPSTPRRTAEEPIKAWKVAQLVKHPLLNNGVAVFTGVGYGNLSPYGVEAEAECPKRFDGPSHSMFTCTCGFYAVKDRRVAENMLGPDDVVLLEVELYGTVLHFEDGYRAQHQRVMAVHARRQCWFKEDNQEELYTTYASGPGVQSYRAVLGKKSCQSPASVLVRHGDRQGIMVCVDHAHKSGVLPQPYVTRQQRFPAVILTDHIDCNTEWHWIERTAI